MNILPVYQTSSPPDVLPLEVVDTLNKAGKLVINGQGLSFPAMFLFI